MEINILNLVRYQILWLIVTEDNKNFKKLNNFFLMLFKFIQINMEISTKSMQEFQLTYLTITLIKENFNKLNNIINKVWK